ncbi:DUF3225 domain-containing protein, partial [Butyricicoccus sp. 1XD8-22]
MNKWFIALLAVFVLAACSNKEQDVNTKDAEQVIDNGTIGFEIMGDNIEEVTDIPEEEKEAILKAFDEYIASFNSKDIDRYINTLSKDPQGFTIEDDKAEAELAFEQYDITK